MVAAGLEVRPPRLSAPRDLRKDDGPSPWSFLGLAVDQFDQRWRDAVDDNRLTLFGFRRYRTSHLLNLRFLETEIDHVDRAPFQAGLSLGHVPGALDRMGPKDATRDENLMAASVTEALILKLRKLLKDYGRIPISERSPASWKLQAHPCKFLQVWPQAAFRNDAFSNRFAETARPSV